MSHLPSPPHAGLDQRLLARLNSIELAPGAPLCAGFSGGNDSLALAIALSGVRGYSDFDPVLVHVDHQLRPESGHDAVRCRELAGAVGLPLVVETLPTGLAKRGQGIGVEGQARRERYLALSGRCRALGAELLVTAHHLDDQAETVLMHLFRGSGTRGAAGMREVSTMHIPWWGTSSQRDEGIYDLRVWRPFLSERRRTLEAYVAASGLQPVMDETNDRLDFRRNVVRHQVLPSIEMHWAGSIEALGRFGNAAGRDEDYLAGQASIVEIEAVTADGALRAGVLASIHPSIGSRVVGAWLSRGGVQDSTMDRINEVLQLARTSSESTVLEVGSSRWVVRFGETLRVGTRTALVDFALTSIPGPAQPGDGSNRSIDLHRDGPITFTRGPDWTMCYSLSKEPEAPAGLDFVYSSYPLHQGVDGSQLETRRLCSGDRWLDSGVPVRDALRQAGVHPLARDAVLCVALGKEVLCIPAIHQPKRSNDQELEPVAWLNLHWTKN